MVGVEHGRARLGFGQAIHRERSNWMVDGLSDHRPVGAGHELREVTRVRSGDDKVALRPSCNEDLGGQQHINVKRVWIGRGDSATPGFSP
jgi:hypothetical protein